MAYNYRIVKIIREAGTRKSLTAQSFGLEGYHRRRSRRSSTRDILELLRPRKHRFVLPCSTRKYKSQQDCLTQY